VFRNADKKLIDSEDVRSTRPIR